MYEFNEKRHIHQLDGKPLIGITTALSVIAKPALIGWAANMACDYIQNAEIFALGNGKDILTVKRSELLEVLKEARTAHRIKKEKAGDWGTIVHKSIEDWIKDGTVPTLEGTQQMAFDHFREWASTNNVEFLESEKHVYSKELWVGGILDMVFMWNGKKYIGDVKTSNSIYPEMWAQMAGYHLCLSEMEKHKDISGYVIINLKKTGEIDLGMSDRIDFNQEFFKASLALYKIKQIADGSIETRRD